MVAYEVLLIFSLLQIPYTATIHVAEYYNYNA